MASTVDFDEFKTRVKSYGYGTADETIIGIWLNQSYNDLAMRWKWPWLEKTTTITTAAGSPTTALPADFMHWGRLRAGADNYVPEYVDAMDMRDYHPAKKYTTEQGVPRYYSLFSELINWYPTPDAVYTYSLDYWKTPTEMSAGTDVTDVPDEYADVLVLMAVQRASIREQDFTKQQYMATQAEAQIQQMIRNAKSRQKQEAARAAMPGYYGGAYDTDVRR